MLRGVVLYPIHRAVTARWGQEQIITSNVQVPGTSVCEIVTEPGKRLASYLLFNDQSFEAYGS